MSLTAHESAIAPNDGTCNPMVVAAAATRLPGMTATSVMATKAKIAELAEGERLGGEATSAECDGERQEHVGERPGERDAGGRAA